MGTKNIIQGTENKTVSDILANAKDSANICNPFIVIKEKAKEQIIREINKPIYEFVGAINDKGEFVRYTHLIRRNE